MDKRIEKIRSSSDGLEIEVLSLVPDQATAIFIISHGMCEHKERYLKFMEFLTGNGFISVIHDHRGHGESIKNDDDLGYFYGPDPSAIVDDVHDVIRSIKSRYKGLPVYLFGHSMGSLVVRCYIQKYDDIDKLIVCGTPCKNEIVDLGILLAKLIGKIKGDHYRSRFLTELVTGRFDQAFDGDLKNRWLSFDEENVESFNNHKKDGFIFTVDGYLNLFGLLKRTYDKDQRVLNSDLPILFIAGKDDPVIGGLMKWHQSISFMQDLGYNVHAIAYDDMRHEILNESGKEKIYEDIKSFILE